MRRAFQVVELTGLDVPHERPDDEAGDNQGDGNQQKDDVHGIRSPGGRAWRQTIFWPFHHAATLGRGTALRCAVNAPRFDSKVREQASVLKTVAVLSEDCTELRIFAINRDPAGEPLELALDLRAFGNVAPHEHLCIAHPNLNAENTADAPDTVVPHARELPPLDHGKGAVMLPPLSWNVLRYRVRR